MGVLICCSVLGLFSCKRVMNEFSVRDPEGVVSSAELQLCGENRELRTADGAFKGRLPISCEGEGRISIRFEDASQTTCHVGYVTPGAEQAFDFVVRNRECR